jgi:hypothetical protein
VCPMLVVVILEIQRACSVEPACRTARLRLAAASVPGR